MYRLTDHFVISEAVAPKAVVVLTSAELSSHRQRPSNFEGNTRIIGMLLTDSDLTLFEVDTLCSRWYSGCASHLGTDFVPSDSVSKRFIALFVV